MTLQLQRRRIQRKVEFNEIIDDFSTGVVTQISESRMNKKMAKQANNLVQEEDGLWTTRPGAQSYGQAFPTSIIDGFQEYRREDGETELLAVGQSVAVCQDGGSWTTISGATFTPNVTPYFLQINDRMYITNGVDNLAYYDGTSLHTYSTLSAPTGLSLSRGGALTTGSYNYYGVVTALNEVGETVGSSEASVSGGINIPRDLWASGDKVTWSWNAVTGATRYQVYISDESGHEVFLGTSTTNSYTDDASLAPNPYVEVPDDNTTGAPKFTQMCLSGNRIWATGDPDNPYRVYWSGTGQFMGFFSAFYGGGHIDLEKGGRDTPKAVKHYRTGKGDSAVTVLCSSPEGRGSIWQIALSSLTVGDTTFTVPAAEKVIGSIGTNAPLSVVNIGNSLMYFNKKGFSTLGNKPNLLNILSTDEVSFLVRPDVRNLDQNQIDKVAGYYRDGKVWYGVPLDTSVIGNSHVYIYDTEHRNWQLPLDIPAQQFGEYTDTSGKTHFLCNYSPTISNGGRLVEISENFVDPMEQSYISGLYSIDPKDKTVFAKIDRAYVELGNPIGNITFTLLGTEKNKNFRTLGSITITGTTSQTGYSWDSYSSMHHTSSSGTPTTFSTSSKRRSIRVRKLLNSYQYKVSASGNNNRYTILSLQVKGKIIRTRDPSSWSSTN